MKTFENPAVGNKVASVSCYWLSIHDYFTFRFEKRNLMHYLKKSVLRYYG